MPNTSDYPMGSQSPPRKLIVAGRCGLRQIKESAPERTVEPALAVLNASADVPTRPGCGSVDWEQYGRVLTHRQLELETEPFVDDVALKIAVERRVAASLYPVED